MSIHRLTEILARDKPPEIRNHHMAAGLFKWGQLLAVGYPRRKTHPLAYKFSGDHNRIHLHAELDAIIKSGLKDFTGTYMIVSRVKHIRPDGSYDYGESMPCTSCMRALKHFGVPQVSFIKTCGTHMSYDTLYFS